MDQAVKLDQDRAVIRQMLERYARMNAEPETSEMLAVRSAVVAEVCGKYTGLAPSTEKWIAEKRKEVELEEQRFSRRFSKSNE